MAIEGRRIRVRGRVQGVGFRPFVFRLAQDAGLSGQVWNDGAGVCIDVWGAAPDLNSFTKRLQTAPPRLSQIEAVDWQLLDPSAPTGGFRITRSEAGAISTEIAPDAATCADCLIDIRDPKNRRYRYPFTNCTHCGPRLSIVEAIPYDRATTTMRAFTMCDDCHAEYSNPADRRFHAQPNACPACGPRLWLEDRAGEVACDDPLAEAARLLRDGAIVAIKGVGGFHLACDALNAESVAELRRRKRRVAKPLALMARDIEQIRRFCVVSEAESRLLSDPAAPIVLLQMRRATSLPGVAPGLRTIGVILTYSPLHHLLLDALDGPIVFTSGNPAGSPQVTKNADARAALRDLVDACLFHDREIVNRLDHSIARLDLGQPHILRRGRGLAPEAIQLNEAFAGAPPTLGLGAELKTTFCLLEDGRAIPSQHIGDLNSARTLADFQVNIKLFSDLFRFTPAVIAVDLHPDYQSTRYGRKLAQELGARLVPVQHHHAHFASCLAEHGIAPGNDNTVGIILDGAGLGGDGTIWGGEIVVGGYAALDRKAHLAPVVLPGGDHAAREPWRNTVAHLLAALGPSWRSQLEETELGDYLTSKPVDALTQFVEKGLNSPFSSSAGRLFDAVAGALGISSDLQSYEGQAAMELEALASSRIAAAGSYELQSAVDGVIEVAPLWQAVQRDLVATADRGDIAARFHNGLAAVLGDAAEAIASEAVASRIVLSGGVFQNRILKEHLFNRLTSRGLDVLVHRRVPTNDGGISLGQAAVAALA